MTDKAPAPIADPLEGHCLCRSVTVTLIQARPEVDICHCAKCRRWGGVFFSGMKGASFEVKGQELVTVFRSSDWAERAFCSRCGSNLWFRFLPTDHHSFLAGLFDLPDAVDATMGIEQQIFIEEKPAWYDLAQTSPTKTGQQIIAEAKAAGFDFD